MSYSEPGHLNVFALLGRKQRNALAEASDDGPGVEAKKAVSQEADVMLGHAVGEGLGT